VIALLSAVASLFGCGESVGKPSRAAATPKESEATPPSEPLPPVAETPVEIVSTKPPAAVGPLERPFALARFFEALARLETGQADGPVRIVQLGDSHTAADVLTGTARRALQERFRDGGRGFVAVG